MLLVLLAQAQTAPAESKDLLAGSGLVRVILGFVFLIGLSFACYLFAQWQGKGPRAAFLLCFFGPLLYLIGLIIFSQRPFVQRNIVTLLYIYMFSPYIIFGYYLLGFFIFRARMRIQSGKAVRSRSNMPLYSPFDTDDLAERLSSQPPLEYQQPPAQPAPAVPAPGSSPDYRPRLPRATHGSMVCPRCGCTWTDDYAYCGECGTELVRR